MATITVRNLDEDVKRALRIRAAENGRSMEEEVREILRRAIEGPAGHVATSDKPRSLVAEMRALVADIGGVEIELPPREGGREPPSFD